MDKILDYLNGRNFEINTIEGAKKAAEHFISVESTLLLKTQVAVANIEGFLKSYQPVSVSKEEMIMATYLAHIGNSQDLFFSNFKSYDAYTYLKYNEWSPNVCALVLLQCMSRELAASKAPELYHTFMEIEQSINVSDVMVYSLALIGKPVEGASHFVEIKTALEWANKIYLPDSPERKHAVLLNRVLYANNESFDFIKKISGSMTSNIFS